jgi:hypothetical protein
MQNGFRRYGFLSCHLFVVLCVVLLSTRVADAQGILFESTAASQYQSANDSDFANAVDPPIGTSVFAEALANPSSDGFSYANAVAEGRFNVLGATLRSFAYASGYDPNYDPPQDVSASSTSRAKTAWISSSPSLSSGTVFEVRATIPISGLLAAEQYFSGGLGSNDVYAEAAATFSADGNQLYAGSARLFDPSAGGFDSVLLDQGDWLGDFGSGFNLGTYDLPDPDARELNTLDIVSFTSTVGQIHNLEFMLMTSAYTVGPFESLSVADFSSTGEFTLSAHDINTGEVIDVTFTPVGVPEPGSAFVVIALAGMTALRRRRLR